MQDKKRNTFWFTGFRLFLSTFLLITGPLAGQKIPFDNFTIHNGLPQIIVNAVCQDHEGYIWFATQVGAGRYDGYEFDYFNTGTGLPDNFINCLMVTRKGEVWLGTEGGVGVVGGHGVRSYVEKDGLVNNRVDDLFEDRAGNVWVVTAYGISVITPDSVLSYTKDDALADNAISTTFVDSRGSVHISTYPEAGLTVFTGPSDFQKKSEEEVIHDIIEDAEGRIWYATEGNGIRVESEAGSQWLDYDEGLTDEIVISLEMDHEGRVWCGTYIEGVFLYEQGRFTKLSTGSELEPIVTEFMEDRHRRMWLVTLDDGIWMNDDGVFTHLGKQNGLLDDIVFDIMEDKFGNIWMATLGGASKYGRVVFEIMDAEHGIPEDPVYAVFRDSRERVWFGSGKHLVYLQGDRIIELRENRGFEEGYLPLSFAEDDTRNIYIGTDRGLFYFNGRSMRPIFFRSDDAAEPSFNSLCFTEDKSLWCATDEGVYVLKNGRITVPEGIGRLADHSVNDLEQVGSSVYCATEGGITVFDLSGRHLSTFTRVDSLASDVCLDVVKDVENNVWVATDRGITKIITGPNPEIVKYSTGNGLTSNTTYFVEFTDSVTLWIGTERGLRMLDITSGETNFYGYDDGFYPLETNARAVAKGGNGDLWIGTIAGLVHYLPKYDIEDETPPDLILYPPAVEGDIYTTGEGGEELRPAFPYNKNTFDFRFTGIHTTIPSQNRFSYILEGYDDDWSSLVTDRTANYKKIPNGEYVFKVKAFNLDGIGSEEVASFAFAIKPPFWKTIWFIMFEVLAGLSLVYATIKLRERQLVKEKRVLESRVRERTKEIEDQKVEIEAQRDEIADQNKEITDSILYASRIQQAVLPGKLTLEKSLPDHFIMFRPRDIVSGDFYWVEQKHDRVIVCAADCTGHGVPGAFISLLGLTFLNEIVNKDEILKANEILNRLRTYIINAMTQRDSQARDGMDLALVVFDRNQNMLEYAGAYNSLLLVRDSELIEYKADKMPIGKHIGEEGPFTNHRVQLRENDMIYLFSDGFPDQFGGEKGSKYKARPFKRLLQKIGDEPVEKQARVLGYELKNWMGDNEQVDDILVMGIRYHQNDHQ